MALTGPQLSEQAQQGPKGLLWQKLKPVWAEKPVAMQWVGRQSILKGRGRGFRGRPGTAALKEVSREEGRLGKYLRKWCGKFLSWVFLTTSASPAEPNAERQEGYANQNTNSLWAGIMPALSATRNRSLEQTHTKYSRLFGFQS